MKRLYILFIFILIFTFNSINTTNGQEFELFEDNVNIETSIVLLNLYKDDEVIKSNYFFEILNFEEEDYFLIPVNSLSNEVDLVIIFDRLSNIVSIKNPDNDKLVKVDLTNKIYIDFEEWNNEPPIIFNNDFFVSSKLISHILDTKIEWKPNYQELAFIGDFDGKIIQDVTINLEEKKEIIEKNEENIYIRKDNFSIGSVNYKLIFDYRDSNYYNDTITLKEVFSIFGRFNNWALSLREEAKYDINMSNLEVEIPFVKAKYQDENKMIIIGDTKFNFQNTVAENTLRGLYFSMPDRLSLKVIPLINLSGEAEVGSEVKLYVNGRLVKEIIIKDNGKYLFEDVVLSLRILNKIDIVVINPNGEEQIITKKITAVEKILKEGTKELEVVGGLYKKESTSDYYDGQIVGLKTSIALNKDLSINAEGSYFDKRYLEENGNFLSSNLGLAYRLLDNTVISLDWYYGDYDGINETGYEANIHYAFESGYIDGYYLYIPNNLSELITENQGKEQKVMAVYNLNNRWAIEPVVGNYESLSLNSPLKSKYARFRLRRTNGWENFFAILGSYEIIEKNYLVTLGANDYLVPGENNRYGTGLELRRYSEGFKLTAGGNIYDNNITLPGDYEMSYYDVDYRVDLYKVLTENILFTANVKTGYEDYSGEISNYDLEREARLRFNIFENIFLTIWGRDSQLETQNINESRYSASLNSYLTENINIYGQYSLVSSSDVYNYTEMRLNTSYSFKNNRGSINLFANYIKPESELYNDHIGYGAGYNILLSNDKEFEIKAGKNYESILDDDYEYYVTLTFAQAFAFVKDKMLGTRFNNSEHRSFVAGYVYLDENNNGVYDKGEKTLPNIEMRLDNIVVTSDENGMYRFNPLFSDVYILNFNYRNLYADYTPVTKEQFIKVRENENIFLNFGLTLNGSISGKIFLDKNNNGIQDPEDEAMSWVGVTLDGTKYDYTDTRGEFYFENVSLGAHKIEIVSESIPSMLNISGDKLKHIYITKDDLDVRDIITPLYYNF
jgi:hypothetical protein